VRCQAEEVRWLANHIGNLRHGIEKEHQAYQAEDKV